MHVLALSGSLRRDSYNTKLLHAAARLLPDGAELELWDRLKEVPPYDEDDDVEPAPAAVAALRGAIAARSSRSPVNGSQLFAGAVSSASRVTRTASRGSGRSVSRFSIRRTGQRGFARAGSSAAAATLSIPKP